MKKIYIPILFYISTILSFAQVPENDSCANSVEITVTTSFSSLSYPEIANATVNNEVGCSGTSTENYVDLWYHFIMPVNGHLQVNNNSTKNNFAIYDACNGTEINCWNAGNIVEGLTAGTTYKLRIFRTEANANTSRTFAQFKAIPIAITNDMCATSENITVALTERSVSFIINQATSNVEVGCSGSVAERLFDVWYDFTMPVAGNIAIKGNSVNDNFAIYDACNGSEIACFNQFGIAEGLIANTNYKIRVFRNLQGAMSPTSPFKIRAIALATNNTCVTSQNLSISQSETSVDFDLAASTQNSNPLCNTNSTDIYDLWYDFTMPIEGNLFINSTGNTNRFTVYDACNGNEIACFTNNKLIDGLTVGANYKLRLYRVTQSAVSTSSLNFTIKVFPQAINDTCDTAENINVTQTNTTLTFDVQGADNNLEEACSTAQEQIFDVWYTFTMPVSGNIEISNGFHANNVAIYDTCNGNKLGCVQRNGVISGLISGQVYKLRVFRKEFQAASINAQTFSIKAIAVALNDTCENAQNITVTNEETFVPFEIVNAQINNEVGCSGTNTQDYGDIWYSFTMPFTGKLFIGSTSFKNNFALYNACNGTEIACLQKDGFIENLTANTNYKLRVFRKIDDLNSTNSLNFTLTAFQTVANDDCAHAETITVDETRATINFQLGGATSHLEKGCDATQKNYVDVWYEFTLPTNGNVHIKVTQTGVFKTSTKSSSDNNFELFAICNGNQISCFNRTGTFSNLEANTTYKLRVFRLQNNNQNSEKSFDIVLETTTLGVDAVDVSKTIQVYPNPVENIVTLVVQPEVLAIYNNINLMIYNTLGSIVYTAKKLKQENTEIRLDKLTTGLYFYTIESQKNILKTGKIVKK